MSRFNLNDFYEQQKRAEQSPVTPVPVPAHDDTSSVSAVDDSADDASSSEKESIVEIPSDQPVVRSAPVDMGSLLEEVVDTPSDISSSADVADIDSVDQPVSDENVQSKSVPSDRPQPTVVVSKMQPVKKITEIDDVDDFRQDDLVTSMEKGSPDDYMTEAIVVSSDDIVETVSDSDTTSSDADFESYDDSPVIPATELIEETPTKKSAKSTKSSKSSKQSKSSDDDSIEDEKTWGVVRIPHELIKVAKSMFPNAPNQNCAVSAYLYVCSGRDCLVPDKIKDLSDDYKGDTYTARNAKNDLSNQLHKIQDDIRDLNNEVVALKLIEANHLGDRFGWRIKDITGISPSTFDMRENSIVSLMEHSSTEAKNYIEKRKNITHRTKH